MIKTKLHWVFAIITYLLAVISYIVALFIIKVSLMDTIFLFLVPLLAFVFPIYVTKTKKDFPLFITAMVCVEILICICGGSLFNLYDVFAPYDLILHCYFGFSCSMIIYYILGKNSNKIKNKPIFFILIFLATMGVGAIWELWEYLCDLITNGDALRVEESIYKGLSPVADTMEDLAITMVGIILFYIVVFIDSRLNNRLLHNFYEDDLEISYNEKK